MGNKTGDRWGTPRALNIIFFQIRAFSFFIKSMSSLRANLKAALYSTQKTGLGIKKNFVQDQARKTLILEEEYWPRLYPLGRPLQKNKSSHFAAKTIQTSSLNI